MKFTLTPNDKLKFKIFEKSELFSDVTLIKNFRFYDSFNCWLLESKEYKRNNCSFYNTQLKIYKNKGEISNIFTEVIEWSSNNGHKDKIPALEKLKNETLSFFDVIIKLLEDNATVDEARATLKEAGII